MQDREYWSYIAGLGTALPLVTVASPLAFPLAIGTGLVWFGFLPRLRNAWDQLTVRRMIGMEVTNVIFFVWLMSTGLTAYAAFGLTTFYLSRAVLIHTRKNARQKLSPLMDVEAQLKPARLHGTDRLIPFADLKQGDIIDVAAGDLIPVDGFVTSGTATIDEHQLTGETVGREKETGDPVFAMTTVNAGRLIVIVERGWRESSAAKLMHILSKTTDARPGMQIKADAYADRAAPIAMLAGMAVIPFGGPMMGLALYNSLPGKQFRLVSPFAMLTTLRQAAQHGVLVKDGRVFESIDAIKIVAFDKTGTLTDTKLAIGTVTVTEDTTFETVLAYAAGVQGQLEHPIAVALRHEAAARGLILPRFAQIGRETGLGVRGECEGVQVQLGSRRFMTQTGITIPARLLAAADAIEATGATAILLAIDQQAVATIELKPTLRSGAAAVIAKLQKWGFHVAIISGDAELPTRWTGEQLGVNSWHAGMLPHEKAALIQSWQAAGKGVCYVGDGMNDGAALRGATLSISLKGAATLAVDEAQVILMRPDLSGVIDFLDAAHGFSRRARLALGASSAVELAGTAAVVFSGATVLTTLALNHLAIWAGLAAFHAAPNTTEGKPRPVKVIGNERRLPQLTHDRILPG